MRKTAAFVIIALCAMSVPAFADSPIVKLLLDEDAKKQHSTSSKTAEEKKVIFDKTTTLSPEAKDILEKHDALLSGMTQQTKDELKLYTEQRNALYSKLSPEAKDVLNKRRDAVKNLSPTLKAELQAHNK